MKYLVSVPVRGYENYSVEADTKEKAIEIALEGDGTFIDNTLETEGLDCEVTEMETKNKD